MDMILQYKDKEKRQSNEHLEKITACVYLCADICEEKTYIVED